MPNVVVALPYIGGALCSRRKVWLTPTTRVPCSNAAKTGKPLKFEGVPQTRQPLGGRSSPYYEDVWGRYRCLTSFLRLSIDASVAKIQPNKVGRWCQNDDFCVLYFQRVQHISDMYSKFSLRPHHVWPRYFFIHYFIYFCRHLYVTCYCY